MRSLLPFSLCAALQLSAGAAPSPAPGGAAPEGFVVTVGRDTVATERFTRSPRRLESDLLFRAYGTRWTFTLDMAADGSAIRFANAFRQLADPEGGPAVQSALLVYHGDTATVEVAPGGTQRILAREGAIPYINPSFALIEVIVQRALAGGASSGVVPVLAMVGGTVSDCTVSRIGADSVAADAGGVGMRFAVDSQLRLLAGVVPSQGVAIRRTSGASTPASVAPTDYGAPAGASYSADEVRVPTGGGLALSGTFTRPRGVAGRVPAVVTITGSGIEDRDEAIPTVPGYRPFRQIADTLGRRGIAVLRLDDRGFGGSGGDAVGATSRDFADDIRAAVRWLRARPDIDPERIALLGHSEGGLIAPMVAADDTSIRAIVLLAAPAWTGRRIIESQNRDASERLGVPASRRDSVVRAAMRTVDSIAVRQPWLATFMGLDPIPTARKVRVPVLILQGETDRQVSAGQADELAAAIRAGGNRDVTVRRLPDTNHLFLEDPSGDPTRYSQLAERSIGPEILGTIADWLAERLR